MTVSSGRSAEIDALERQVVDHLFTLYPHYAVSLGLHEYDGRLPLTARDATDRWLDQARPLETKLVTLAEEGVSAERKIDVLLLRLLLGSARIDLVDSADLDRNPMAYFGALSLTSYIARDYAPLPQRVEGIVRILEAVPSYLDAGRGRLRSTIPAPFVKLALSMGEGLPTHFAEAEEFARKASPQLGERVASARRTAEDALSSYLGAIREEY